MAFVFVFKDDFTAPNGVGSWLDDRWIVRSFKTPGGNEVASMSHPRGHLVLHQASTTLYVLAEGLGSSHLR